MHASGNSPTGGVLSKILLEKASKGRRQCYLTQASHAELIEGLLNLPIEKIGSRKHNALGVSERVPSPKGISNGKWRHVTLDLPVRNRSWHVWHHEGNSISNS